MGTKSIAAILAGLGSAIAGAGATAAPRYVAVPLPFVFNGGVPYATPVAINGRGDVVLRETTLRAGGAPRAILVSGGSARDIGTLGGSGAQPQGINDSGEVVGDSGVPAGELVAFLYSGGSMRSLGTLPGDTWSAASGINASGAIVGCSRATAAGSDRPFLHVAGSTQALAIPGFDGGCAVSINTAGTIAGYVVAAGRASVATWSGGILAVVPGVEGVATDINDRGDVVGRHTNAVGERRAFRLTAGTAAPVDLGTLGGNSSEALAVNGRGVIVGTSNSPAGPRAFVLDGGAMQDLNSLVVSGLPAGHVLQVAYDVNDAGQIVGLYQASAIGPNYPYRLDPVAVAQSPAEVPALAPGALAGLAVLLVAATAALRRRPR